MANPGYPTITIQPGEIPQPYKVPDNGQGMQMYSTQYQYGQPIVEQPGAYPTVPGMVYVPPPQEIPGVPPGLEYLSLVDTVVIQQIIEVLELLTNYETKNKYSLRNANGDQIFYAAEESNFCHRQCCGNSREFTMHIIDNFKREVMRIHRPFKCCGGTLPCFRSFAHECTIECPPGNVIGTVVQKFSCCASSYQVQDENGADIFTINGPCCCMHIGCQDKEFPIATMDDTVIGSITKKWGGCIREAFTDADTFNVHFPENLDVKLKAVLLGATFLVDFIQFEKNPHQRKTHRQNI